MLRCHNAMSSISFDFDEIHEKIINDQRLENCVDRGLFTLNHFYPEYFGQFPAKDKFLDIADNIATYRGRCLRC